MEYLAREFDEKIIWDFLHTIGIDDLETLIGCSEKITSTGCNNDDCTESYNGATLLFFNVSDFVAYDSKNNKFFVATELRENSSESELNKLEENGIEFLDYFQFDYCEVCGSLSCYIE